MTNYSSVIIDFDGTLFDTRRAISATLSETFAAYNVPPPPEERVEEIIGRGITLEETLTGLMPQRVPAAQLNEWVTTYRRIYSHLVGVRNPRAGALLVRGGRDGLCRRRRPFGVQPRG